jgi:hypothetical protein
MINNRHVKTDSAEKSISDAYTAPQITTYTLAVLWQRLGPASANTGGPPFPTLDGPDFFDDPVDNLFD